MLYLLVGLSAVAVGLYLGACYVVHKMGTTVVTKTQTDAIQNLGGMAEVIKLADHYRKEREARE